VTKVVTVCAQCSECQREEIQKARVNGGTIYDSLQELPQGSPLPLTDPHHMVIKQFLVLGIAADYRSRRWMWSTLRPTIRCLWHSPAN